MNIRKVAPGTLSLSTLSLSTLSIGTVALIVLLAAGPAMAVNLFPGKLKRNVNKANGYWESGQLDRAVELYESILDATEPAAPLRVDALYALSVVALQPDTERHDPERARTLLAELTGSFPGHGHSLAARTLLGLLEGRATAEKEEAERRGRKLAAQEEAFKKERRKLSTRIGKLEAEQGKLQEELAAKSTELTKKCNGLEAVRKELENTKKALETLAKRRGGGGI